MVSGRGNTYRAGASKFPKLVKFDDNDNNNEANTIKNVLEPSQVNRTEPTLAMESLF